MGAWRILGFDFGVNKHRLNLAALDRAGQISGISPIIVLLCQLLILRRTLVRLRLCRLPSASRAAPAGRIIHPPGSRNLPPESRNLVRPLARVVT